MRYEIGLYDSDLKSLSIHLNSPLDYAKIVIASARFFLLYYTRSKIRNKYTGRFVLRQYSKGNARIFIYHQNHKYVSFSFPFRLRDYPFPSLDCEGWSIDSRKLDILESILEELVDDKGKPKKGPQRLPLTIAEIAEDLMNNFDSPGMISMNDISIFSFIMMFEPGYIRYDYDPHNAKGLFHPKHHLDINYSSNATYKYGLYGNIDSLNFEKIFEKEEEKQFLHPYHKLLEPIELGSSNRKNRLHRLPKKKKR